MNRYEKYIAAQAKPTKIRPWGKKHSSYLIPYEYGHMSTEGVQTDGGRVWWVLDRGETSRDPRDPNQEPFTVADLDLSEVT